MWHPCAVKGGIPFYRRDVYVNESRKEQKGSVETVARCLRYDALYEVMEEGHFTKLATAHHEDDQAETILFHLLRGSGLKGLTGIKPKRGRIIRPFLGVTKRRFMNSLLPFMWMPVMMKRMIYLTFPEIGSVFA